MATTNAYDTLQQNVVNASSALDKAKAELIALQSDAGLNRIKGILLDSRVNGNPAAWIDANGTWWQGADAGQQHADGTAYYQKWQTDIKSKSDQVTDLQNKLTRALSDLASYEKNSPVASAAIAAKNTIATLAATNKTKLIAYAGAALLGIIFIIGIVVFFKDRKKYAVKTT